MLTVVWCPCLMVLKIQRDSGSSVLCFVRKGKGSNHVSMWFLGSDKSICGHEGLNSLSRLARASHRDFQRGHRAKYVDCTFSIPSPAQGKSSGSRMRASVCRSQINYSRCLVRLLFQHCLYYSSWVWFRGLSQQDERGRQRKTEEDSINGVLLNYFPLKYLFLFIHHNAQTW